MRIGRLRTRRPLAKYRNARGDRVVDAADFLREHGIADACDCALPAAWDEAEAGLRLAGAFTL